MERQVQSPVDETMEWLFSCVIFSKTWDSIRTHLFSCTNNCNGGTQEKRKRKNRGKRIESFSSTTLSSLILLSFISLSLSPPSYNCNRCSLCFSSSPSSLALSSSICPPFFSSSDPFPFCFDLSRSIGWLGNGVVECSQILNFPSYVLLKRTLSLSSLISLCMWNGLSCLPLL